MDPSWAGPFRKLVLWPLIFGVVLAAVLLVSERVLHWSGSMLVAAGVVGVPIAFVTALVGSDLLTAVVMRLASRRRPVDDE